MDRFGVSVEKINSAKKLTTAGDVTLVFIPVQMHRFEMTVELPLLCEADDFPRTVIVGASMWSLDVVCIDVIQ